MGQARRRSKKKSEFTLPKLQFDRAALSAMKEKCLDALAPLRERWLALPRLHRRALTVLVPVVTVLWLLPSSPSVTTEPETDSVRREVSLDLGNNDLPPVGERAEPVSPQRIQRLEPVSPAMTRSNDHTNTTTQVASTSTKAPELEWQRYQIQQGQTLANIFREKSLPLSDLYAVAAIEGKDKPLSKIKSGQWIRYKQNASGDLDAIQIETTSGKSVMYYRLSDGSFSRGK
ncbi:LysM-like peptidoglycan-binding domain-containing protein [Photobacterium kagoshimensis]|uniref:LysM-like peptidoglycan-binding domain-containing protein n=1 Tax=Photobacterium kagoshimensis TaxID=2910242 RepID=UPI003D12CAAE